MRSAVDRAGHEAQRLGHRVFGPSHVIVAVLRGEDCAAQRALHAVGLTQNAFEARFADHLRRSAPADDGTARSTPLFLAARGAALAFAAIGGRTEPDANDALLGVLYANAWTYAPHGGDWTYGQDDGDEPSRIVTALRDEGVTVPAVAPPERRPWRSPCTTEVPSSLMDRVVRLLLDHYPPGLSPRWGFNTVDGRQVIIHEAELEIATVVAEARGIAGSGPDSPPTL